MQVVNIVNWVKSKKNQGEAKPTYHTDHDYQQLQLQKVGQSIEKKWSKLSYIFAHAVYIDMNINNTLHTK